MADNGSKTEQVKRIENYEKILDEALELIGSGADEERLAELVSALESYYTGPLWRKDFEDDEAGLLPGDLKRGVLSEDGIYDVMTAFRDGIDEEDGTGCSKTIL